MKMEKYSLGMLLFCMPVPVVFLFLSYLYSKYAFFQFQIFENFEKKLIKKKLFNQSSPKLYMMFLLKAHITCVKMVILW